MSRNKLGVKIIAIMLCMSVMIPYGAVATGEELQDSTEPQSQSADSTTPQAQTEQEPMKVSDELLRVLKQLEGFNPHAYWDYKQYSIGYGSKCPAGYEMYYSKVEDGGQGHQISEEYAEELLRGELDYFEKVVNNFITRHNLTLAQHQYDALISFTYNTGYAWTSTTGNLVTAVINGDIGSHFIYGIMLWSMAGNRHILVNRRIVETNIYANGVYPADVYADEATPDRYRIAFMDGNGGTVKYDEHGFDAELPIPIKTQFKSAPTGPDETGAIVTYELDGWYTERVGGTKVEQLDSSIPTGTVLYAHWKTPAGTPVIIPRQESGLKITVNVTGENVNVRSGPDTYYYSLYKANPGETLEIAEVVSRGGLLWGRSGDKWIALKYTDYNDALSKYLPMWGKVTSTTLNVRTGAGTNYALVEGAQKKQGDLILVSDWKSDGSMMWGKIEEGWVALPYVTFEGVKSPDQTVQSIEITQKPDKLSYVHKVDALDITGGKLLITYMDGTTSTLDITPEMVSGFDNTNVGTNTLTVTYEEQTATFEVQIVKAKVIFQMEDGTVISEKEYLFGDTVEIPQNPSKDADNIYTYTFTGWDKEVVSCEGNAIYTAIFEPVYIDYTVKFQDENGQVISEQTYHWGDTVTIPADPAKPADNTYTYTFAGWDAEVAATCSGNAVYTATYQATYIEYTVTFQLADGTVIKQYTLHYGDAVEVPEAPVAPEDYLFTGWDKPVTICQGDAVYIAIFAPRQYAPGDLDGNEKVNTDDVFQLLLYISLPDMFPVKGDADFTGDNAVTTDDVFQLLLHISLPDMFPL